MEIFGRRKEVSERLADDVRQGVHARKVMESYQTWLGEGPELSVLRMLGLFDRSADEKALEALLTPPAIRGLTESLTDLSPTEWRTILAQIKASKTACRRRSAQSWVFRYASSGSRIFWRTASDSTGRGLEGMQWAAL